MEDRTRLPALNPQLLQQFLAVMNADPRAALRAAFLLGEHVAEAANGIGVGTTPADKVISLLIGIASGKETLVPSGAELRAKAPDTPGLESIRDANQKAEHVAAHLILESLTPAN